MHAFLTYWVFLINSSPTLVQIMQMAIELQTFVVHNLHFKIRIERFRLRATALQLSAAMGMRSRSFDSEYGLLCRSRIHDATTSARRHGRRLNERVSIGSNN